MNHPLKTLALVLALVGLGWLGYEFIHVRGLLRVAPEQFVAQKVLDRVRESILEAHDRDLCFYELGPVHYRPKENHYRVEFTVADECVHRARGMCEVIAEIVEEQVHEAVGVFAYNRAGNPVAHFVK